MSCISKLSVGGRMSKGGESVVEERGEYRGYEYLVIFTPLGHRCGYVAVSEHHPLHDAQNYDGLPDIDMHGGCTFYGAQMTDSDCTDKWIGFDAAHCDDAKDMEALNGYFPKSARVEQDMRSKYRLTDSATGTVKTQEYMARDCKGIIDQIHQMGMAA